MAALFEGDCIGRAVNPEFGADGGGKPRVRWEMEVTDGPHKGKRARYSGKLDEQNIKYTKQAMVAIGWRGKDVRTFVADVKATNATVPFVAEIARFENKETGKTSEWTSARSIGFAAKPLAELEPSKLDNVNKWFAEVGDVGTPPPAQQTAMGEDDLPFE